MFLVYYFSEQDLNRLFFIVFIEIDHFNIKPCMFFEIWCKRQSSQECVRPFLGCVVVFTDQSCREGSCKRRKQRGRCKWSRRCRAQLHSHQCFRSSQGHSSRSHIHSCSRCVCYCMCLRSDRCLAAVCIHPRHQCKTDLETKRSQFQ